VVIEPICNKDDVANIDGGRAVVISRARIVHVREVVQSVFEHVRFRSCGKFAPLDRGKYWRGER
jgi:hypothetical protein